MADPKSEAMTAAKLKEVAERLKAMDKLDAIDPAIKSAWANHVSDAMLYGSSIHKTAFDPGGPGGLAIGSLEIPAYECSRTQQ
jgi:hypothetical protein